VWFKDGKGRIIMMSGEIYTNESTRYIPDI
jgi:hypothetical protein